MSETDLEIDAFSQVAQALVGLDDDARARVIEWAAKRYNVKIPQSKAGASGRQRSDPGRGGELNGDSDFDREFGVFADLFDATSPKTEADRALVGGYWFQNVEGLADFAGQQVNNALKDVGHGVGNITNALGNLQNRKPALVRQVAKSGRTRQARKKYKLTTAGVSAVNAMMNGAEGSEDDE